MISRRKAAVVATISMAAIGIPKPASANWYGATNNTGCASPNKADNQTHTIYYSDLESGMSSALDWYRGYLDDNTAVTPQLVGSPTSTTDAVVYDFDYTTYCGLTWDANPGNVAGLTTCVSTNGSSECEKHEVRFDSGEYWAWSGTQMQGLACHEMGHSLGLDHSGEGSSCMLDGQLDNTGYTDHDKAHLANDLS